MSEVTVEGTQELMSHRKTSVILATGGMGLVRAAYSSGKPAFGVGPGNVPAYIESSADVPRAVKDVLTGKSYDNGTLCCSEQALLCDAAIETQVRESVSREGGSFLSKEQIEAVSRIAVLPSRLANPEIVGKSAPFIAGKAGFEVPRGTRVLVAELQGVGRDYPLSIEKLSPILAFYVVKDWKEGCERSKAILAYGGMGHTLSIHSSNDEIIREFALQKPAFRIIANSPATHGAVGFSTGLSPAMTLGCGAYGGNITSDNITPLHLINVKRLAYGIRPVDISKSLEEYGYPGARSVPAAPAAAAGSHPKAASLEEKIARFLSTRGVAAPPSSGFEPEPPRRSASAAAPAPQVAPLEFISEGDVRSALHDGRKLPVGPGTLITPSARDLGNENNVFLRI
jgi:acetaldehyde dehydrogenase (acetylating)